LARSNTWKSNYMPMTSCFCNHRQMICPSQHAVLL
jgi:hypothetical protein